MSVKHTNNGATTLVGSISSGVTSFEVASVATLPTIGTEDFMYLTIDQEVIKVTDVSGTICTCVATGSPHTDGATVELRMCSEVLTAIELEAKTKDRVGRKNFFLNGGFQVDQRDLTVSSKSAWAGYFADRWYVEVEDTSLGNASVTIDSDIAIPEGPRTYLSLFSASVSYDISKAIQYIPQKSSVSLTDREVTVSARTNFTTGSIKVYKLVPSAADDYTSSVSTLLGTFQTGSWNKGSITFTLSESDVENGIGFAFQYSDAVYCGITNIQLELGDTATDFEYIPYEEELALCQHYFWKGKLPGGGAGNNYGAAGSTVIDAGTVCFPITMRKVPVITIDGSVSIGYLNCTHYDYSANKDGFVHRVDVIGNGSYRAVGGIYLADSEID